MTYMFLYPLIPGALVFLIFTLTGIKKPDRISYNLYNSGIAALTIGSLLQGIFKIAGTSSSFIIVYWIAGFTLIGLGVIAFIRNHIIRAKT